MSAQTVYMMIGNVGCGKSTTAKTLIADEVPEAVVINIDTILQAMFPQIPYHDLFENPDRWALYDQVTYAIIFRAVHLGISVIIDATNMSVKKRGKLFAAVQGRCPVVGIVHTHVDGLKIRQKYSRGGAPEVWATVHARFAKAYEAPTMDEGFSQLIAVRNFRWTTYYEEVA